MKKLLHRITFYAFSPIQSIYLSWRGLFSVSILAVYFYTFMEWLFFATKPSFMDAMPLSRKLEVFLLTALVLCCVVVPLLLVLRALGEIPGFLKKKQVFLFIAALVPALFVAVTCLLMVDNFTYTVLKFGIVNSRGLGRLLGAVLAVFLLAVGYRQILIILKLSRPAKAALPQHSRVQNMQTWLAVGLLTVSIISDLAHGSTPTELTNVNQASMVRQPNIIIIGSDGVTAGRMSLYGYQRNTTPRLTQLAETSLLAENNFTNATSTTGSVFSILTGKYPATTRLLYSPNILHGIDAYQHLPGILKSVGYTTVQIAYPYYADAYAVNMLKGFDEVNGRGQVQDPLFQLSLAFHLEDVGYFLPSLFQRILDRLQHIFFIRTMENPYQDIMKPVDPYSLERLSDEDKINDLVDLLVNAETPMFVHVHLMGTHGDKFYPRKQVFSVGETQSANFMNDFYDDAVLDYDTYMGELVDRLTQAGLMDQTVIVVYSDHADQWRSDDRIPLMFHFPDGEFTGKINNDTQNLDIAPTLLDYLGIKKPDWMAGQSLLRQEPPATRPIFSVSLVNVVCQPPDWWCVVDPQQAKPPFYQFGFVQLTVCQKMWMVNLTTLEWSKADVPGHTAPCNTADLPNDLEAHNLIINHLRQNGFNVSRLK